jgi:MOSC domain-containing protein YiiM
VPDYDGSVTLESPFPGREVAYRAGEGTLEAIYVAPSAAAPVQSVQTARALAGLGLEGDRYTSGAGTYSATPGTGRHLTLIDAAALTAVERQLGIFLPPGASRRNLVTRGVELDALIGRRFWIGEVLCEGMRACPPCDHLERLTQPGVLRALVDRGGLRADILQGGTLRVGDAIRLADGT